ncbi:MAG: polysaccharide deacetylase family protein [Bacteroidota bacterium]
MFLHKTPWLIQKLYPSLIWKQNQPQTIYLTFDDGPIPGITPFIQDTLTDFKIKATFFCVGDNLRKYREIAQESIRLGHTIANHTFNHLNGWKTNKNDYLENIELCENLINELGVKCHLFRPPYGKISKSQIQLMKSNYRMIMWDVLTGDYSKKMSTQSCLEGSIKATDEGSIVLFHDNIKAEKNIRYSLPRYIEHFLKRGYRFDIL